MPFKKQQGLFQKSCLSHSSTTNSSTKQPFFKSTNQTTFLYLPQLLFLYNRLLTCYHSFTVCSTAPELCLINTFGTDKRRQLCLFSVNENCEINTEILLQEGEIIDVIEGMFMWMWLYTAGCPSTWCMCCPQHMSNWGRYKGILSKLKTEIILPGFSIHL